MGVSSWRVWNKCFSRDMHKVKFIQKDFAIDPILQKPLMAYLATVDESEPMDSPVWFLWEASSVWLFGKNTDSFIKRLEKNPSCALSIVDFNVSKGILQHIGIRGSAHINEIDQEKLHLFLSKYLGSKSTWNSWFVENIVNPLNRMVQISPKTIVAKDASFFKTGPNLASI